MFTRLQTNCTASHITHGSTQATLPSKQLSHSRYQSKTLAHTMSKLSMIIRLSRLVSLL